MDIVNRFQIDRIELNYKIEHKYNTGLGMRKKIGREGGGEKLQYCENR